MLDRALTYGEVEMPVFGTLRDCKTPYVVKGRFEHGCHDATIDPDEIRWRWTVGHPGANISIATGDRCGAFVLDVDDKGEVCGSKVLTKLEERHGALPATSWLASTPSGGRHYWFRKAAHVAPLNNVGLRAYHSDGSFTKLAGLDVRTSGGSVCVWPSAKPNGPYQWIRSPWEFDLADPPAWLVKLIDAPPPPPAPRTPFKLSTSDRTARYVAAAVNGECSDLARMGQGSGRNLRLFQASANLGTFVGAGLLPMTTAQEVLERAADDCGLWKEDGPHAVRATIKSGMARGFAKPREVAL